MLEAEYYYKKHYRNFTTILYTVKLFIAEYTSKIWVNPKNVFKMSLLKQSFQFKYEQTLNYEITYQ